VTLVVYKRIWYASISILRGDFCSFLLLQAGFLFQFPKYFILQKIWNSSDERIIYIPPTCCRSEWICITEVEVEVEVNLRPTVSLGVRRPSETRDQFFFLL
jgi:hypothetical protein